MHAQVIMNDEEWVAYKKCLGTDAHSHLPQIPPSFPVLVFTVLETDQHREWAYQARHSFIELVDMQRFLGAAS